MSEQVVLKITYDPEADALYLYLRPGAAVAKTRNFSDDVVLDFDSEGNMIGFEVLDFSVGQEVSEVISTFGLDPDLADALDHIRSLTPRVKKELVLA